MTNDRSRAPRRCLRIVIHSQHLAGVGHYVRMHEIARSLAQFQQVYLVDGGRQVPRVSVAGSFATIPLPRIAGSKANLFSIDGSNDIRQVMRARSEYLTQAIAVIIPDLLIIEDFPFSKWMLR